MINRLDHWSKPDMSEQETISISIFDKSFKVSCPPDEVRIAGLCSLSR